MHMADALVSPPVATGMAVASLAVGAYSIFKIKKENKPENIPVMGVMGAFVFATQMVNFTIPGTGSSGHLCFTFCINRTLRWFPFNDGYTVITMSAFC